MVKEVKSQQDHLYKELRLQLDNIDAARRTEEQVDTRYKYSAHSA